MSCYFFTRGGDNTPESNGKTERVQELKEKMTSEIKTLFAEQYDQMKKKKEQCATEVSDTEGDNKHITHIAARYSA